jgi:hypothetical protein
VAINVWGFCRLDTLHWMPVGDILDNNGANTLNLRASSLRMVAGGVIGGADLPNAPDANSNALDTEVGSVAARSARGIYLQELASGGDLVVGHVQGAAAVAVRQVRFNSTTTLVTAGNGNLQALDDLETTAGPVKVVVRGGNLTINDGTDADGSGVIAAGASDILLWASANLDINAQVKSGGGNLHVHAGGDLQISSGVSTTGVGTILLTSVNDLRTTAELSSQTGDMLIEAGRDVVNSGNINSQRGNVAIFAARDLSHSGGLSTAGNVIVDVGRNHTAGAGSYVAGNYLIISAGSNSVRGSQTLGSLTANQVLLEASGDIVDGNLDAVNVQATALRMTAEGIGSHSDPLDLAVVTLAAQSTNGIYLRQLATSHNLTIGHVDAGVASVAVQQANFNSSTSSVERTLRIGGLDDLETQTGRAANDAAIEVQVISGNLIVTDGQDADGRGVLVGTSGAIVLQTTQAGSIGLQTGIETKGLGVAGNITLDAFDSIDELARVAGSNISDAKIIGHSLTLQAGQYAHLHNVDVDTLTAQVGANGVLDGAWQQTNARANDKGDDFLDQLGGDRQSYATAAGVMVEVDRGTSDSRLSAVRESYAEIARQFRFEDTYQGQYALFLQNAKTLEVLDVTAGAASDSPSATAAPTIYIETLGATANLDVKGTIGTHSSTATEGGIVLVAGGKLHMNGALETEARLSAGVFRTQRIERIGNALTTNALGQAAVGYLNGHVFDGGDGLTPRDPLLTSTQFVIRDQLGGLSALVENYRTHVFQSVVAQYGFEGEAGFVTLVGYADGEIQQFDVQGEAGTRTKTIDQTNSLDQSSLPAAAQTAAQATAFSRATSFDSQFLNANQDLLTATVARRAADFFLFENGAAQQASDINDLTVESFQVANVSALGAQGATEMPRDLASIQPPDISIVASPPLLANPVQLVRNDIELQTIQERTIEVAIYRVYYEDRNQNGQADASELPSEQDILAAEVIDAEAVEPEAEELEPNNRLKVGKVKIESGGSPTAEDIEELKNEFLDDPLRPSGAYAIIEKGLDDKEVVLDVFSVRDMEEAGVVDDQPLIQLPSRAAPASSIDSTDTTDATSAEAAAEAAGPRPAAEDSSEYRAAPANDYSGSDDGQSAVQNASRFAHAGLVASSLWFVRLNAQAEAAPQSAVAAAPVAVDSERFEFGRRARRRRRFQRQQLESRPLIGCTDAPPKSNSSERYPANPANIPTVPVRNGDSQ